MKRRIRYALAIGLAGSLAASCSVIDPITQPVGQWGGADFGAYVAMGTSISAGTESGGLVDRHQVHSFPALFAQQVGKTVRITGDGTFTLPTIGNDGYPPLLRIVSLNPLVISNGGRVRGFPNNGSQSTPYHNMAVPGSVLPDVADSANYYVGARDTIFSYIVRHRGTILQQIASLSPTFVSFEYGSNEVLGPAVQGSGNPLIPPATFAALLNATLDGLQALAPNAKLALFTIPEVTTIPFFTTFPPFTVECATGNARGLLGPGGTPLGPGDRVLLSAGPLMASGTGFRIDDFNYVTGSCGGNGNPLPDQVVLTANEAASLSSAIALYNDAVRTEASARGAALVDLHGLLATGATTGFFFQGSVYTSDFVTGGLFSLDGVHPTDLGHGIIANAMIDALNARFGANIPAVNLSAAATASSSRLLPAGKFRPVIEDAEAVYRRMFPWHALMTP